MLLLPIKLNGNCVTDLNVIFQYFWLLYMPYYFSFRWFAKRFLHPDIVAEYSYIFLWDEDLGVENFNVQGYILKPCKILSVPWDCLVTAS